MLFILFYALSGILVMENSFAEETETEVSTHAPITQKLIELVDYDQNLKKMLIVSIEKAKKANPDKTTNPAQTLDEYYAFIDWAALALPWTIEPSTRYSSLYDQIDQSLDYFYFISDQPLPELEGKGYYNNSLQYHEPYRSWMKKFTKEWGNYLSKKESWNDDYLKRAMADKRFGLQNGWYEDPSNWKSFNDFFARYLKSPAMRPITDPDNDSIVIAPTDSKPQGVWKIDSKSNIESKIAIKSNIFTSIKHLIGEDSDYKDQFAGGTLTHTFLDINDYHRYHFPVDGVIKEVRIINADDAIGGIIKWDPKLNRYMLYSTFPNWESIETRGCVIVQTEKYGLIALLPVGMSQISSVNFEKTVKVGAKVKKGDMLGYFLFGGSDFVIVFQKQTHFTLTVPEISGSYQHVLMGEKYGQMTLKKE